jgi:ATP-binding cassette subfamily B protein/subfamily B ATP-binding cassette protein MsbA
MPTPSPPNDLTLPRVTAWAMGYAGRRRGLLAAVLAAMFVKIGLDLLKPWPMLFLLDYVLQHKPMPAAVAQWVTNLPGAATPLGQSGWAVAATVLIFLLSWSAGLAGAYTQTTLGQRMIYDLAADLFARLQQLSLHFHYRRSIGDLVRRVTTDCTCISVIVKDALAPLLGAVVNLAAMFLILWRVDASLAAWALAVVPYLALVFHRYARPMMERGYEQQEVEGKIYSLVEQTFAAIATVQSFGREAWNAQRLREAARDTVAATLRLTRVQLRFKVLVGLGAALGTAAILWIGAEHALSGRLSIGAIILFLSYLSSFYEPLVAIMYSTAIVEGAAGSARRVREILRAAQPLAERPGAVSLGRVQGRVQWEGVTFGYEPGRPVLRRVSLELRPGEMVALVGPTGSGKSTLAGLVPRFFDPWEGRVLLDGCDLRDISLDSLRRQVAMVPQEPFLFPLTIAENIAYGHRGASPAEIEAAARAAGAHPFIERLPRKYRTVLGERGATLSAGERQRLSIARALLKNAPILILDEPTSALDVETETAVVEAWRQLARHRTTLVIAHRLSTIRDAQRIVVLQDGQMAEMGTHADLLARGGLYARYYALQFGGTLQ